VLYQTHHPLGNDVSPEQQQQIFAHLKNAFNIEDKKHGEKMNETKNKDVRSSANFAAPLIIAFIYFKLLLETRREAKCRDN